VEEASLSNNCFLPVQTEIVESKIKVRPLSHYSKCYRLFISKIEKKKGLGAAEKTEQFFIFPPFKKLCVIYLHGSQEQQQHPHSLIPVDT